MKMFCSVLLCAVLSSNAQAALFSSSNATVNVGGTVTVRIFVTGDQRTVGGQMDVNVPVGFSVSALPLSILGMSTACVVLNQGRTVRVIVISGSPLTLLPTAKPLGICNITVSAAAGALSGKFEMGNGECVDSVGNTFPICALDSGYMTVVN